MTTPENNALTFVQSLIIAGVISVAIVAGYVVYHVFFGRLA